MAQWDGGRGVVQKGVVVVAVRVGRGPGGGGSAFVLVLSALAEFLHGDTSRACAKAVPDPTAWCAGRAPMTRARCWPGADVMEDARARRWPRAGVVEAGSGVRGSGSVASAGAG